MRPLSPAEFATNAFAGFQVFFARKEALGHFGNDRDAFLKSFWPAVLLFPILLFFDLSNPVLDPGVAEASLLRRVSVESIKYTIDWTLWPLIMAYMTLWWGKPELWCRYVISVNWMVLTPIVFWIVINLLFSNTGNVLSEGMLVGLTVWLLLIHGWLLQTLFKTGMGVTLFMVTSELLLALFLEDVALRVIVSP